jgi:hypothetical protein
VLAVRYRAFHKHSFFFRHVTAIFGSGLLTSEGDFWLRQRQRESSTGTPFRFRVDLEPDRPVTPFPSITLRPAGGVPATVRRWR